MAEGFQRGLFHYCPDEEVLRGPSGEKILNGAGAVPKAAKSFSASSPSFAR